MINENARWFVIFSKGRWEKKVTQELEKQGYEVFCPLKSVQRQWSDRKKLISEPLFPNYIFVKTIEAKLKGAKRISGFLSFIYWLDKLAVVREEEIVAIKQFLLDYDLRNISVTKTKVNLYDQVKILGGPLMEREGKIIEVKNQTVRILLPSIGFEMVADVEKTNIELLPNRTFKKIGIGH